MAMAMDHGTMLTWGLVQRYTHGLVGNSDTAKTVFGCMIITTPRSMGLCNQPDSPTRVVLPPWPKIAFQFRIREPTVYFVTAMYVNGGAVATVCGIISVLVVV